MSSNVGSTQSGPHVDWRGVAEAVVEEVVVVRVAGPSRYVCRCAMVWVQGPMLVQGGANAMMIPERIQGLSKAVSDDPARNGISRLDEMMSGAVGVDMLIE